MPDRRGFDRVAYSLAVAAATVVLEPIALLGRGQIFVRWYKGLIWLLISGTIISGNFYTVHVHRAMLERADLERDQPRLKRIWLNTYIDCQRTFLEGECALE